jgi:hypothetical protein
MQASGLSGGGKISTLPEGALEYGANKSLSYASLVPFECMWRWLERSPEHLIRVESAGEQNPVVGARSLWLSRGRKVGKASGGEPPEWYKHKTAERGRRVSPSTCTIMWIKASR